ncbi:hypothetical protein MP638_000072 [Amoeboaphelidium occidentale]|nr:hypothetical protein MP638_000072 [Amoeboaphelidium occidentale]
MTLQKDAIALKEWFKDLLEETLSFLMGIFRVVARKPNPVRTTPNFMYKMNLLTQRAFQQQACDPYSLGFDFVSHVACALFISLVSRSFDYLGAQPSDVCAFSPVQLRWACSQPQDYIIYTCLFTVLGAVYAGILGAGRTFAYEKPVFWRECSTGLSSLQYYVSKALADIPKVVTASFLYFMAVNVFTLYRSPVSQMFLIILLLYFNATAMGYFIAIVVKKESFALVGSGVALAWTLAFSGITPSLSEIDTNYWYLSFIWSISPTRWACEALWLIEVNYRSFVDAKPPNRTPRGYKWDNYSQDLTNMFLITLMWHCMAIVALKLLHRNKQR